jgi:hypothetical protein
LIENEKGCPQLDSLFYFYGIDVRTSVQRPRVKSGNFIGIEPLATEISLSGPGALHAAAS